MLKLLWAWATVSFSTHPECLKAPFTSIWSFDTFTRSEFAQLMMLQQLRQVYTKSCNYKITNNLDHVQTSRCVHIHHVQTRPTFYKTNLSLLEVLLHLFCLVVFFCLFYLFGFWSVLVFFFYKTNLSLLEVLLHLFCLCQTFDYVLHAWTCKLLLFIIYGL